MIRTDAPAQTNSVWVLFCLLIFPAVMGIALLINCKLSAVLFLEPNGGTLLLRVRYVIPLPTFYFRISLLQAPYFSIDLLKHNGEISPIYRAFQKKEKANPWGAAIWNSARWKELQGQLTVGIASAPAAATFLWAAAKQLIEFLLRVYISPSAILVGSPTSERTTVRLKVEGMATVNAAQIILEQLRLKKENRKHHGTPH